MENLRKRFSKPVIILFIVGIVIIVLSVFFAPKPNDSKPGANPPPFVPPTGESITVQDQKVTNFYNQSSYISTGGDAAIAEEDSYQIYFSSNEQKFLITIAYEDKSVRDKAEADLLQKTGVSKEVACKLNVEIKTYKALNFYEQPQISKLSFCQNEK